MKCLQEDLVPKSVKIHYPVRSAKEVNIIHRAEKQILNARIGQSISKLEQLHEQRQRYTEFLSSQLSNEHFQDIQGFVLNSSEKEKSEKTSAK